MRPEKWLIDTLLGDGAVAALVSDRVDPVAVPQAGPRPVIVIRREKTTREYDNQGNSGLVRSDFSVMCLGRSYDEAGELATVSRLAIEGRQVDLAPYMIEGVFIEDEYDDEVPPYAAEGEPQFAVTLAVAVQHTETTRHP